MTNYNTDYVMMRITGAYLKPNRETAIWRNFSGRPTNLNPKGGNRYFTIDLNKSQIIEIGNDQVGWKVVKDISELINMGWKIKIYDATDRYPDSIPNANLNVVVSYEHKGPRVFQYTDTGRLELDIDTIGGLDSAWISRAQIKLGHSKGMTAYLNEMHVYLKSQSTYEDWAQD